MKYKIYMDNCCFNRPYDDQTHPLIRLETEAKLLIQQEIIHGKLDLVWSFILHFENNDNPYLDRKTHILSWETKAADIITFEHTLVEKAHEIMSLNIRGKDALHIACTLRASADFFITTDKKLLNKGVQGIALLNPMDFLRRYYDEK